MLFTEWNLKDALEVAREEARETALEEGEARGVAIGEAKGREELFSLLESGMSLAEAKQKFGY
jgi:hypothetical protein